MGCGFAYAASLQRSRLGVTRLRPAAPPVGCGRSAPSGRVRAVPAVGLWLLRRQWDAGRAAASRAVRADARRGVVAAAAAGRPGPAAPGGVRPPATGRASQPLTRAEIWEAPAGVPGHGACSGLAATTRMGWTRQGAPVEGTPSRAARAACLTPCCGNGPPIAPRPLLCYPYSHPGLAALMTTRAPSVGRRTPPTGLHPKRPWGQDRGCLVRETSPSGSTDTRAGPGQDGWVRPPPALGVPVATAKTSRSSTKGSPEWQRFIPRCLCLRPRAHRPGRA